MSKTSLLLAALTLGTAALTTRNGYGSCCFSISSDGQPLEQLSDGQLRLYQSYLSPTQFCLGNGGLTDSQQRGCVVTKTNQIQCDTGASPTPGFAVGCDGKVTYNGGTTFTACPTGQNGGFNIYTVAPYGQGGCKQVTLDAPGASCKAACPQPPPSPSPKPAPPPAPKTCPTQLTGNWEFPHLIVPVDSSQPDKQCGTQYNGDISQTVSTIFNFDIPGSYSGKTCSVVFLFPQQKDLQTSSYSFSGSGDITCQVLSGPATPGTSYSNQPGPKYGEGPYNLKVSPGNEYTVATWPCPAGQRIGVKMSSGGDTKLNWFEDYNPKPIGLYVTAC